MRMKPTESTTTMRDRRVVPEGQWGKGAASRWSTAAAWSVIATLVLAGPSPAMTTTVTYPFLGVTHTRITTTVPRLLSMNLIEVDLAVQGIGFTVTPSNGTAVGETVGRTTRQFAAEKKTQVAINGGFSAWTSGSNYVVEGLAADRGTVYSEFEEFRTFALNVSADNVASILRSVSGTGTARTPDIPLYNVLPGEARLLRNGMLVQYANETLHPRTGVGLNADASRLYLMTVDGRNSGHSLGVTRPEFADFMRMFGATDAINLDGGGSSTLVFSDTTPRVVNVPVGLGDVPGTERTVGSNFGVFALPVPAPAAVTVDIASGTLTQTGAGHPLLVSTTAFAKTGRGTLVLDRANVFTAPTTVRDGTLRVAASRALAKSPVTVLAGATLEIADGAVMTGPGLTIAGGTLAASRLEVGGTAGLARISISGGVTGTPDLAVGAGGTATFSGPGRSVSLGSLTVDAAVGGGRLDLGLSRIDVTREFSAAAIAADLAAGRNGGGWDGPTGIVSPAAAALGLGVGWRDHGGGIGVVAAAYPGDCNLDGVFDILDIGDFAAAARFNDGGAASWVEGDFTYDGVVDLLDVAEMLAAGGYAAGPVAAAGFTTIAVPEPSSWPALAAGTCSLLAAAARRGQRSRWSGSPVAGGSEAKPLLIGAAGKGEPGPWHLLNGLPADERLVSLGRRPG